MNDHVGVAYGDRQPVYVDEVLASETHGLDARSVQRAQHVPPQQPVGAGDGDPHAAARRRATVSRTSGTVSRSASISTGVIRADDSDV